MLKDIARRWRSMAQSLRQVLSINHRNLVYIYPRNKRSDFPLADNKLKTKELLLAHGVAVPKTYLVYGYFYELANLQQDLAPYEEFVIKPASGRGGGGIVVIAARDGDDFVGVNGTVHTLEDLRKHISDIIFGVYSFDLHDQVIIEARLQQHEQLMPLSPHGLADVRVVVCDHSPVMAMIRLATKASKGTANLHQGAVGVGIDMQTGVSCHAVLDGEALSRHPDTGQELVGFAIPYWEQILNMAQIVSQAVPLKYLGIDVALENTGPRVLEINVRPGIEIQNANLCGMRGLLENLENRDSHG